MAAYEIKDVFISYHGGQGDDSRSSYPMAEELYHFLEGRGISCFLYKKSGNEDFYDAIDFAIKTCRHFVLVARDPQMLAESEWVRDELKQFDGLRKNGQKKNCFMSAYIYGSMTEAALYQFNSVFTTKDIAKGERGFEVIYNGLHAKMTAATAAPAVPAPAECAEGSFEDISTELLDDSLRRHRDLGDEEFTRHCAILTRRIRTANPYLLPRDCTNVVDLVFERIRRASDKNLFKIVGATGTQKSYVLQLLYLQLLRRCDEHTFTPVYLHLGKMKKEIRRRRLSPEEYVEELFAAVKLERRRAPLFIVDGVLNVVTDNYRLDYLLKRMMDDRFPDAYLVLGVTNLLENDHQRQNKSGLFRSKFASTNIIQILRISIYEKEDCIRFLSTFDKYDEEDLEPLYEKIYRSGIMFLDEHIADLFYDNDVFRSSTRQPNLMHTFEASLLDALDGDDDLLAEAAADIFEFAYGDGAVDYSKKYLARVFELIAKESVYLHCLIAYHWLARLEQYQEGDDFSFFQMVMPKEITRFLTARIKNNPKYEASVLLLGRQYNSMTALGKSEMSFFLGRICHVNYFEAAVKMLEKYFSETKLEIRKKEIDAEHNGIPYHTSENKQDLFLLRGISVSLIYCGKRDALYEYIHSLIENDLCNSINRGFHLEYYGDKPYSPMQNSLDYEDNPRVGERTLNLLCDSAEKKMMTAEPPLSLMLEVFTVASLLQARIQTPRAKISFNITPYVERGIGLLRAYIDFAGITDNIIAAFFKMALADLEHYLESGAQYDAKLDLCTEYLCAKDIKRTGWVQQGLEAPESITEHMYACWLIALVNLPNKDSSIAGYDKKRILDMLLIHDLAETRLRDIPKYEKKNYPGYDALENDAMLAIFLKGTYPEIDSMSGFAEAWNEWYQMKSENAKIAKDIDTIQAIYQFLEYLERQSECFGEQRILNWLREVQDVRTRHGKAMLQKLILDNPRFKPVLDKYAGRF